jgi:hypothetical protein
LEALKNRSINEIQSGHVTIQHAICRVLYTFCKVRGEKVIVGFLNNEPRYVEPLLSVFERGTQEIDEDARNAASISIGWEERYILLLWLSHLMLAPFDLSTISSFEPAKNIDQYDGLELPPDLPGIPLRVIPICFRYLQTATKEQSAAAQLLVRLCLRPDMRKVGLLDAIIKWALSFLQSVSQDSNIHQSLGILSVLSRTLASGNQQEIGHFIAPIFKLCQQLMSDVGLENLRSSAVARKIIVKMLRNIVVHCLKAPPDGIDTTEVLEEVIELLLELLADGDTPVRYAASKALSVLTLQLDPAMATDVIEAILGSLTEDVLWDGSSRNLAAVNPLRWHGLTLTLGHLLYRRAIPTIQLPEILNALLLALNFEQRSATGSSVGTNVRDAANFGIWSISRRYTTKELLAVETSSIRAAREAEHKLSIPQLLAIQLIESACLDPAGNIRRGSSAALQELIGRHPDTIVEGIPLVQIVDFHAVGLRQRAITEVAITASQSSPIYRDALFHALLGWRGIDAVDSASRVAAATAIGLLSSTLSFDQVVGMVKITRSHLTQLKPRQVEEQHGLMIALAKILSHVHDQYSERKAYKSLLPSRSLTDLEGLFDLWAIFTIDLPLSEKDFTSQMLRPELTATATMVLLKALGEVSLRLGTSFQSSKVNGSISGPSLNLLNLCLVRAEDAVLVEIPSTVKVLAKLATEAENRNMINSWLAVLHPGSSTGSSRSAGRAMALGSIYEILPSEDILHCLTRRCIEAGIEERVVAIRSLGLIVDSSVSCPAISLAVLAGLNDYTINERGDVGSLVRVEALNLVDKAWRKNMLWKTWPSEQRC